MKILIVNYSDVDGGAARAAKRLHKALTAQDIDCKMLVNVKKTDDYTVIGLNDTIDKFYSKFNNLLSRVSLRKYNYSAIFSPSPMYSSRLIHKINSLNPDIVHLHWVNAGMLSVKDIPKIKAPIVWSLHDNWSFTGGCHTMETCEKYKEKCGECPILNSDKKGDISRKTWEAKHKYYNKKQNLYIVGLSRWIYERSKNSSLLKDRKHFNLPNLIDVNIFKQMDKSKARELLNLPKHKKLILFGAYHSLSDNNKGFTLLTDSLKKTKGDFELIVFGGDKPEKPYDFGFKAHYLGHLNDDISLVVLYSATDVTVVPSRQENLSNTIMESLSCGTPVVAFDVGGNSDMIDHEKNGYLARPYDSNDLANGIDWVINHKQTEGLSKNARDKIVDNFESNYVVKKYIDLYQQIINE